jgi:DNA/RNA endonuclease YhcR with UshA esterase domain
MNYRHDRRKLFAPALLALVLLFNLAPPVNGRATPPANPPAPAADVISIAEARSLPLGTVVTIDGSVTVASGAFNSSTFEQGFAIQDHTGGIYVSTPDNLGFAPRQQVRVTGTLADNVQPGLLVLTNVTEVKAHGSGPKVQPLPVATGAVGEATEGKLVRITGTITQPVFVDLPYGYIIFINDGSGEVHSFVAASTSIDLSGLSPGQTVEVTGFSGQFADSYEVDPRTQADIKVLP